MLDVPRPRQLRAWILRDRLRRSTYTAICNMLCTFTRIVACSSAMVHDWASRYNAGANSWLQKVAGAKQIAESLDDVFSLSSFRNAQWNQWLSLKVQVQPVLRSVLACGRSLRFRQGKNNLSVAFAEKLLSSRRSEQQASLWCTCNPVASSPNKGVSLLAR